MNKIKLLPINKVGGGIALGLAIGLAVPFVSQPVTQAHAAGATTPAVATSPGVALPDFTDLVDKAGPAVVNIRTTERVMPNQNRAGDEQMEEFFRRFFGQPMPKQQPNPRRRNAPQGQEEEVPRGVGSGFIISQDGFILTNAHVVDGASEVYVKMTDKREFKAKVIGADRRTDVAVLKIDAKGLPKVNIGDSDKAKAGEWVIAIGSPFELENTVTAGIISAKARDTGDLLPLIQTDVAVNPGNSGGPLINMRGEVIGINSQIYSRSGGYMGISFAIPIDEAMRVADQLKASGRVVRGFLGVERIDVTKEIADSLGLAKAQGALIQRVMPGSPAEKAGVKIGDVVVKVNGTVIEKALDLNRIVGDIKPGGKANLTVLRNGANKDLVVTVGEADADKPATPAKAKKEKTDPAVNYGLYVSDLTEAQKRQNGVTGGVVLDQVEAGAARVGLQQGDVILMVNNVEIQNSKDFAAVLAKIDPKKSILVLVKRGEVSQFVTIRPAN